MKKNRSDKTSRRKQDMKPHYMPGSYAQAAESLENETLRCREIELPALPSPFGRSQTANAGGLRQPALAASFRCRICLFGAGEPCEGRTGEPPRELAVVERP